jgi:hypothetical protein
MQKKSQDKTHNVGEDRQLTSITVLWALVGSPEGPIQLQTRDGVGPTKEGFQEGVATWIEYQRDKAEQIL